MSKHEDEAALAAEKLRIIREGELWRIKLVHSKALVGQALQPDALMHGAIDHAVGLAQARLGGLLHSGDGGGFSLKSLTSLASLGTLKTVMPYALTVGSFIARRKLIKPVLILATAAGVGVAWLMRRKTSPQQEQL
ncbi:hypothetical protein HH213_20740 [Duganella dendranthematis]|uniref:DUF883 family protein n=1 Tax=Duganella dendranthematis TaxID=2728021 RepID=A0ABX6MEL5_9BURK|nr:hypothetical protein [Duganella dendranthematis]QJD92307.1 hypothetical protein HH213_20740 [Duganella dendranthematis]